MPRNTVDYWDRKWQQMLKEGRVGLPAEPRYRSSALACVEDAEKGKNRRTPPKTEFVRSERSWPLPAGRAA